MSPPFSPNKSSEEEDVWPREFGLRAASGLENYMIYIYIICEELCYFCCSCRPSVFSPGGRPALSTPEHSGFSLYRRQHTQWDSFSVSCFCLLRFKSMFVGKVNYSYSHSVISGLPPSVRVKKENAKTLKMDCCNNSAGPTDGASVIKEMNVFYVPWYRWQFSLSRVMRVCAEGLKTCHREATLKPPPSTSSPPPRLHLQAQRGAERSSARPQTWTDANWFSFFDSVFLSASCSTNLSSEYLWEQLLRVAASQEVKARRASSCSSSQWLSFVCCWLRVLLQQRQQQLQENVSRSRILFSQKTTAQSSRCCNDRPFQIFHFSSLKSTSPFTSVVLQRIWHFRVSWVCDERQSSAEQVCPRETGSRHQSLVSSSSSSQSISSD